MRSAASLLGLLRSQWSTREQLERWQLGRLRRLVRHAYAHVPFYRRHLDEAGVQVDEIRTLDDLRRIPVVTREQIRELPETDLIAAGTNLKRTIRSRTSGATGVPLEIVSRFRDRAALHPSFLRVYLAWGLRPWQRLCYFQARPEMVSQPSWYERFGVFRRRSLFSLDSPDVWIETLRTWRPQLVHGYALTLKLLAEAVRRAGIDDIHIPLVVSTSGMLDEAGRTLLSTALHSRVVDVYASEEAGGVIAWECPLCTGYHINLDAVILEVLCGDRLAKPGDEGKVVITNLNNFTMPFIRYDQGDTVRLAATSPTCGRAFPLLEEVCGRVGDYVVLPSGRRLTPHPFFLVLDHAVGVGEWQIVQETVRRLRVRVTLPHHDDHPTVVDVRDRIEELVGGDVEVIVEVVDEIRRRAGDKLRSVMSAVPESVIL